EREGVRATGPRQVLDAAEEEAGIDRPEVGRRDEERAADAATDDRVRRAAADERVDVREARYVGGARRREVRGDGARAARVVERVDRELRGIDRAAVDRSADRRACPDDEVVRGSAADEVLDAGERDVSVERALVGAGESPGVGEIRPDDRVDAAVSVERVGAAARVLD